MDQPGFFGPPLPEKIKKIQTLLANNTNGWSAERDFVLWAIRNGYEVERTGTGHDYKLYERNLSGKRTFICYCEIKSSKTASVSEIQKKVKAEKRGRWYKIIIVPPIWHI